MKKAVTILLVILVVLAFLGFSYGEMRKQHDKRLSELTQSVFIPDGKYWLRRSDREKVIFIAGFLASTHILTLRAQEDLVGLSELDLTHSLAAELLLDEFIENFELINITAKQLYLGLEAFYEDYRNRNIEIVNAIYVVRAVVRGEDRGYITAQTHWLRKSKEERIKLLKEQIEWTKKGQKGPEPPGIYKAKDGKNYYLFDHFLPWERR